MGYSKSETDKILNKNKLITAAATILHEYHDGYIVDDTISDTDVVLIALFLREGISTNTEDYKVKEIYLSLGRALSSWDIALKKTIEDNKIDAYYIGGKIWLRMLSLGIKHVENIFGLSGTKHYILKSGTTFSATKQFENFLKAEIVRGEILLCDPYISPSTLYPFSELWGRIDSLKILTSNISEKDKFQTCTIKLKDEHGIVVEVKINQKIHDRYLISGNKCWLIGTSIKDLGNKDCVLKEVNEIAQSLADLFWERWKELA